MKTHDHHPEGYPVWFDLMTPDVKGAADFYAGLFGWHYSEGGAELGYYHNAHVQERVAAGFGQMPEGADFPSAWAVYFAADDVNAMTAKATALGATVVVEAMEIPTQGYMTMLQDPTGAVFGLWQPLEHKGFGITEAHGAMTWCEVATRDAEAAKAFYTDLLGASAEAIEGMATVYYLLKKDGHNIGGIMEMTADWPNVPPHWMPYFQVTSADGAVQQAEAAGGGVHVPPFDIPYGRMATLTDPYGAAFSIIQPPPVTAEASDEATVAVAI